MATCIAASTATKRKTEASVTEGPTVVDTSESVRCKLFLQNFARLVDAVRPVVVKFAVNALSKSLISEYNKCDAENPAVSEFNRASVLMSRILPKIKDSDAHFDAFVAILQELNITSLARELKKAVGGTREDSDSGSASGAESVHIDATGFKCPCGQCSLEKYFRDRSKCPGLQETAFPFLDTNHLSRDERETLEHHLIADTNRIREDFKEFSDAVFKALERNETPVHVRKIRGTVFSSAKAGRSKTIPTAHGDKLETITTISDLKCFLIRHEYISFINYGILEALIKECDECKECQEDLDSYLQKFKDFSRRNVFEVPSDIFTSSSTPDNLLVVKVFDEMWFGAEQGAHDCPFTLRDIKSIQNKIADVIEHNHRFIHLVDVGKGCIQLAFEILSCQEAPIFPLSTSQLSELIRCGIIVLYQPNVPSLPTNIQDTGCQTHDSTESKTVPSAIKTHRSRSFSIPSTIDSTITTETVPSAIKTYLKTYRSDPYKTLDTDSGFGSASCSPNYTDYQKEQREAEEAWKKSDIEEWKEDKAVWQQMQREAEERVRGLQSRLAQTTNEDDQRDLERKIHDEEKMIKVWKEEVQLCEEWINKAESELLALTVKEQSQHQTLSGKEAVHVPLTLKKRIAKRKNWIEVWKEQKANYQQKQREAEEEVRCLQNELSQTTNQDARMQLEEKIQENKKRIKMRKEKVQRSEEWIDHNETELQSLEERLDTIFEFDQSNFNHRFLSMALNDLRSWHKLGLILGLVKIKLDKIRMDFGMFGNNRQRDEMVKLWVRSDRDASWEKLCTALDKMHQYKIANQIRRRFYYRSGYCSGSRKPISTAIDPSGSPVTWLPGMRRRKTVDCIAMTFVSIFIAVWF